MKLIYETLYKILFWVSVLISIYLGFKAGNLVQSDYGFPWNYIALIFTSLICHITFVRIVLDKVIFRKLTEMYTPVFEYDTERGSIRYGENIQYIPWQLVVKVEILTTDKGPWEEDVWWLFHLADVDEPIGIPQGAENNKDLFDVLDKYFAGADMDALFAGMVSVDNALFRVWSLG